MDFFKILSLLKILIIKRIEYGPSYYKVSEFKNHILGRGLSKIETLGLIKNLNSQMESPLELRDLLAISPAEFFDLCKDQRTKIEKTEEQEIIEFYDPCTLEEKTRQRIEDHFLDVISGKVGSQIRNLDGKLIENDLLFKKEIEDFLFEKTNKRISIQNSTACLSFLVNVLMRDDEDLELNLVLVEFIDLLEDLCLTAKQIKLQDELLMKNMTFLF